MPNHRPFTLLDLFSGVGGISLGAARAGFDVVGAVDNNGRALTAHGRNFPNTSHITADLMCFDGVDLLEKLNISKPDGIVGGPPCQGFSTIGRRRTGDGRNDLFSHFFHLISKIKPRFFVAENVTGILEEGYREIIDSALSKVEKDYHVLRGLEVKASDFGAPTSRRRVLFIGFLKTECNVPAEHQFTSHYAKPVVVSEALEGLPEIDGSWQSEEQGWREIETYRTSKFGKQLRGNIPKGVGCKDSILKLKNHRLVSGCLGTLHTPEVVRRYESLLPGGKDQISKSVRLRLDGFCPTLRAGTGPELGSFQAVRPIHPLHARVITPREAARLQGFPDWFQFDATKWHSFRMIGNSVSPILAEAVLGSILKHNLL